MSDLPDKLPRHVAVIMDGNGRWAKGRGLPRLKGHEEGAESARAVIRACKEAGIEYLTLYAFSLENWVRPKAEVAGLMKLLMFNLKTYSHELHDNQIRLKVIGRVELLPGPIRMALDQAVKDTESYTGGTLMLALSYGSRPELVDAARSMAQKVKDGGLSVEEITEEVFSDHLYTAGIPDPDLMIRTSGEQRISNYLLWQLSYSELYFTDVYWPDFREEQFYEALREYAKRKRRFGDITEKDEADS